MEVPPPTKPRGYKERVQRFVIFVVLFGGVIAFLSWALHRSPGG